LCGKVGAWWPEHFLLFMGHFEGVLEKVGGWAWFFCGENVVECVANTVILTVVISPRKIGH